MPRDFLFFKKNFVYFILFLDPFEILAHHPTADGLQCLKDKVQRIIDILFREEHMI